MEAFDADIGLLPVWVQYWMNFLGLALVGSAIILMFNRSTRLIAILTLLSMLIGVPIMVWMHAQMGMVKLLGIVHVVFWTPIVLLIWKKLQSVDLPALFKAVLWILALTMVGALVFDYADVVRWVLGNRAPVV